MDQTALFTMSYGVYVLGTKLENKLNACIINTGMQVTSIPEQISITVAKTNLTHDMVKASGQFSLTTLSEVRALENVKRFGMQSGRDVNKFDGIDYKVDVLGNPYIEEGSVAVLTGKVTQTVDVGTHTIFIASVIDAKDFKENKPMTYAAYRELKAQSMPQATKNEKYLAMHKQISDWTYAHFPDAEFGEWYGYLHRDGTISQPAKGNLFKGPFHIPRMMTKGYALCQELLSEK